MNGQLLSKAQSFNSARACNFGAVCHSHLLRASVSLLSLCWDYPHRKRTLGAGPVPPAPKKRTRKPSRPPPAPAPEPASRPDSILPHSPSRLTLSAPLTPNPRTAPHPQRV